MRLCLFALAFTSLCLNAANRSGYVDIMPADKISFYKNLMPAVNDASVQAIIKNPNTMWYDSTTIVPGYQDSIFDPMGFRPNTLSPDLINTAVPGGWDLIFAKKGRFGFPFGTGGADLCDNLAKINFWSVPRNASGDVLPVAYWKMSSSSNFMRWRWVFPVGTVIGEVLMVQFPDGDVRVSEIRVRTRNMDGWTNKIFRPFPTSRDLANAIMKDNPNWMESSTLTTLVQNLMNQNTLSPRTLATTQFPGAFDQVEGSLDYIPDFGDPALVKQLLKETSFKDVGNVPWKTNGSQTTYAASTKESYSIVPRNYDGGMLPVNDQSCNRCHKDAGRQFNDFHTELVAYGDLWGEDQIFSWHPFETQTFVDSGGEVVDFNNDNRTLRKDFVEAGLLKNNNPSADSATYKEIPHDWKYNEY